MPPATPELCVLLPLLGAAGIVLCGRRPALREGVTLATSTLLLAAVISLHGAWDGGQLRQRAGYQLFPGLLLQLQVDALGLLFALVAAALWPVTSVYAIGYLRARDEPRQTRFHCCFALAMAAAVGVAFAANLPTLFVFYELLTLATYPLVVHAGTASALRGGRIYLALLLGTSMLFFLPAIVGTWLLAGSTAFVAGGVFDRDSSSLAMSALLLLFVFGIGKAAMMPVHVWLPAAMVAPTPVSALLHAVAVVKAGVFALLKVCQLIFGADQLARLPVTQLLVWLSAATILFGALMAMRQDNLKARLAYSTVSQLACISAGALLGSGLGTTASAMHLATHAFGKITLFFCAGAILVAAGRTRVSELRGLGRQMPLTMLAFALASLSIIGSPPLAGTWSKSLLLLAAMDGAQWLLAAALLLSSLLNIHYLLAIPVRAFMPIDGAAESPHGGVVREAPWPMLAAIGLSAGVCLLLFFWPQALYELARAAVAPAGAG